MDGPVLDASRGNEPHVTCAFRLNFFGYDEGQLASISLTAVAPTQGGTTTLAERQTISTLPAQGGVYGGSYPAAGATVTAGDLGLDPGVAHHVKVSVESFDADGSPVPGGAKHKVFWLDPCGAASTVAAAAPVAAPAPTGAPVLSVAPSASVLPVQAGTLSAGAELPGRTLPATVRSARVQSAPLVPVVARPAALSLARQGVVSAAATAQGAGAVLAAAASGRDAGLTFAAPRGHTPASLPFTGAGQLLILLLAGVVGLVSGAALLVAARTGRTA